MRFAAFAGLCAAVLCALFIASRSPEDEQLVAPAREASLPEMPVDDGFPPAPRRAVQAVKAVQAARKPLRRFAGRYFSIHYPSGWRVETAEVSKGEYLDTTIRSPQSPATYLRVDVTPGLGSDPAVHAAEVESYLRRQPSYRRIGLERTKLGRFRAQRWVFDVVENGVRLRKVDVFLTDANGNRVAVLTQAPESVYQKYAPLFEQLRSSLVPRA